LVVIKDIKDSELLLLLRIEFGIAMFTTLVYLEHNLIRLQQDAISDFGTLTLIEDCDRFAL